MPKPPPKEESNDLTARMGEEHMCMGQAAHDLCTTEAQSYHMRAKDQFIKEWQGYQEEVSKDTDWGKVDSFVLELLTSTLEDEAVYKKAYRGASQKWKIVPGKPQLQRSYAVLRQTGRAEEHKNFEKLFMKKSVRSNSGVVVITVVTAPGPFSCPHDCHYCPDEPGQPRSYLSTEPAVSRANQNKFCPVRQFYDRAATLAKQGHTVDKVEIIVLGGTWSGYPWDYQYGFCRDLFFAANTFDETLARTAVQMQEDGTWVPSVDPVECQLEKSKYKRERLSLEEEQKFNELADCKIIGLTLETRPDYVSIPEVRRLRQLGCTRVQIGVQHTDDEILKKINRGCTLEDCCRAVKILKDHCFKVDIHLMPDLPGSTPEKDWEMFEYVLFSPHLQADHWKIYPCEVTPFSAIEEWYSKGSYMPYTEKEPKHLVDLLVKVKSKVHPWIRLNRVIRDIPVESIIAGNANVNLRQVIFSELAKIGECCRCIRCREVRDWPEDPSSLRIVKRDFRSSEGDEVFVSMEGAIDRGRGGGAEQRGLKADTLRHRKKKNKKHKKKGGKGGKPPSSPPSDDETVSAVPLVEEKVDPDNAPLYGLLRLRFNDDSKAAAKGFSELADCALIRELHVYGTVTPVRQNKGAEGEAVQHVGVGRQLMAEAERMAVERGYSKIAVIAGVGVRNYYRKLGYVLHPPGNYLIKDLSALKERMEGERWWGKAGKILAASSALALAFGTYKFLKKH